MAMGWQNNIGMHLGYLQDCEYKGFADWLIVFCQHYTNVSHLVPISLYVVIEVMKLILTVQIENQFKNTSNIPKKAKSNDQDEEEQDSKVNNIKGKNTSKQKVVEEGTYHPI
jgi:hypothetical protein